MYSFETKPLRSWRVVNSTPFNINFFPCRLATRVSASSREMLTFVRSMMEWLGGTISKEDVGEEAGNTTGNKRKRDDDNEDEALGAFALRFR